MIGDEFLFQWDCFPPQRTSPLEILPRTPHLGDTVNIEGPPDNVSVGQVMAETPIEGPQPGATLSISVGKHSPEGKALLEWLKDGNDVGVEAAKVDEAAQSPGD